MFQRTVVIVSFALFAFVVSAPLGAAQQPSPSPCGLLQRREIKAALHGTVGAGDLITAAPDGTRSVCQWLVMRDRRHGYGFTLDVRSGYNEVTFKQQRHSAVGTKRTIVKLGDDAYSERYTNCSTAAGPCAGTDRHLVLVNVWILHGSVEIDLGASNVATKPLIKLGRLVLARL